MMMNVWEPDDDDRRPVPFVYLVLAALLSIPATFGAVRLLEWLW